MPPFGGDGQESGELPECPVCLKPVRELNTAIAHRETGKAAHFDCVLRLLREERKPSQNERICYLGKGSFGVVEMRSGGRPMPFFIRERIQYEQAEPDWRTRPAPRLLAALGR